MELNQSVQLFNCKKTQVFLKGKVNLVQVAQSSDVFVQVETVVSQLDLIQSKKISVQVLKVVPTINVETCAGVKLYLSDAGLGAEIVHFCSEEIRIIQFEDENEREFAVCTHFVAKVVKGAVVNDVVEAQGE